LNRSFPLPLLLALPLLAAASGCDDDEELSSLDACKDLYGAYATKLAECYDAPAPTSGDVNGQCTEIYHCDDGHPVSESLVEECVQLYETITCQEFFDEDDKAYGACTEAWSKIGCTE